MTCRNGVCRNKPTRGLRLEKVVQLIEAQPNKLKEFLRVTSTEQTLVLANLATATLLAYAANVTDNSSLSTLARGLAGANGTLALVNEFFVAKENFDSYSAIKEYLEASGWNDEFAKNLSADRTLRLALYRASKETGYQLQAERVFGEMGYRKQPSFFRR